MSACSVPLTSDGCVTEEELWETAESIGQCHVHSGDDSGTRMRRKGDEGKGGYWWSSLRVLYTVMGDTWLLFNPVFFQGSYLEIKKQMDKLDPLAHPLLQWWVIHSPRALTRGNFILGNKAVASPSCFCLPAGSFPATDHISSNCLSAGWGCLTSLIHQFLNVSLCI